MQGYVVSQRYRLLEPLGKGAGGSTPALDAWLARAQERNREARFTSAQEMAQALQQASGVAVA